MPTVLKFEKLQSSRSHCFVKARFFLCLLPDNFQADVANLVLCDNLAWAIDWVRFPGSLFNRKQLHSQNSNPILYFKPNSPNSRNINSIITWNQPAVTLQFSAPRKMKRHTRKNRINKKKS